MPDPGDLLVDLGSLLVDRKYLLNDQKLRVTLYIHPELFRSLAVAKFPSWSPSPVTFGNDGFQILGISVALDSSLQPYDWRLLVEGQVRMRAVPE